jgi:hypothetical protein
LINKNKKNSNLLKPGLKFSLNEILIKQFIIIKLLNYFKNKVWDLDREKILTSEKKTDNLMFSH